MRVRVFYQGEPEPTEFRNVSRVVMSSTQDKLGVLAVLTVPDPKGSRTVSLRRDCTIEVVPEEV